MPNAAEQAFRIFNLCEGVLWILIGLAILAALVKRRRDAGLKIACCVLFVAFGVSDFVEIHTGGWHKPWWLLVWKALTLCALVAAYVWFREQQKARPGPPDRRAE